MTTTATDCRSAEGVTVGLIDSIITAARVLADREMAGHAVTEALADLRTDADLLALLGSARTPTAWLRSDGMKAMTADEKTAWLEAGRADLVADYTIPLVNA